MSAPAADGPGRPDPVGDALDELAMGDVILADFPRMMGKIRPGAVIHVSHDGQGRLRAVAAAPGSTRKTNQCGRLALENPGAFGLTRATWLLIPMSAVLPQGRIAARIGRLTTPEQARLEAELVDWFGDNWRRTVPPIDETPPRARILHPVRAHGRRRRR